MTADESVSRARALVADLRGAVVALHADFGGSVDVRRLEDDVTRLAADLDLLASGVPGRTTTVDSEIVYISDEEYSPGFWADSEDEGLGAQGRR